MFSSYANYIPHVDLSQILILLTILCFRYLRDTLGGTYTIRERGGGDKKRTPYIQINIFLIQNAYSGDEVQKCQF